MEDPIQATRWMEFRRYIAFCAGLVSFFAVWFVGADVRAPYMDVLTNVVLVVLPATCAFLMRSRSRSVTGQVRRSLQLGTGACLAWTLGHVIWLATGQNDLVRGGAISISDIGPMMFGLLFSISIVYLARFPSNDYARSRVYLDLISMMMCTAFLFIAIGWASHPPRSVAMLLQMTLMAIVNIAIVTFAATLLVSRDSNKSFNVASSYLLIAASLAFEISDIPFSVMASGATYSVGSVSSAGYIACFSLILAAVMSPRMAAASPTNTTRTILLQMMMGLPIMTVLTTLFFLHEGSTAYLAALRFVGACLLILVFLRIIVSALEQLSMATQLRARAEDTAIKLSKTEQQFSALVQNSSDVIAIIRVDGSISYMSPSIESVLGYSSEVITQRSIFDFVTDQDRARVVGLFGMAARRQEGTMTAEWRMVRSDSEQRQVEVLLRNLTKEPAVSGIVLNLRDVTERKQLEDQLTHQALHDDLTGLANRTLLQMRIEQALSRWLFQNEPFTLVVVDLDDFKSINDSLGHVAGDKVLRTVAERIAGSTRRGDSIVRLAGDEFAVLLEGVAAEDVEAHTVARRIISSIQQPMRIEGRQIAMRVSLGLACVTDEVSQADDLMRNADLALHAAKSDRRGGYVQFEARMHDTAMRRVEIETDLRRALVRNEFVVFYQPTVDMKTGCMKGAEALIRWEHPEKGMVSPIDFIPIAEDSGLIVGIGTWVLEQACAELKRWQDSVQDPALLTMNVNLSSKQLDQPDVVSAIREIIARSGIAPSSLVLEMTESVLMENKSSTLAKMNELTDLGITLAIDDFGTGYSSLSYLRQFPIGQLKIDRAFVNGVGANGTGEEAALVLAIIELAKTLQLQTVAEGIETADQYEELRRMGCDFGQGYLMARPAPASDVRATIASSLAENLPMPTVPQNAR